MPSDNDFTHSSKSTVTSDNTPRTGRLPKFVGFLVSLFGKIKRYRKLRRNSSLIRNSDLFNAAWYLSSYPDIAQSGIDPERHYLQFGGFEGRDPSPYFSSSWYLSQYEDVLVSGENPLVHYLRYGSREGRRKKPGDIVPGQIANISAQNRVFHAIKISLQSINIRRIRKAFGFFIRGDFKSIKQRVSLIFQNADQDLMGVAEVELDLSVCAKYFRTKTEDEYYSEKLSQEVDIIVPVYNGMAFLPALFECLYKNTDSPFRVIVIDDRSTDPAIRPFLEKLENAHENMLLLFNEENVGFVKSVNIASTYVRNHFVILNTDVEVPEGWLQRLMSPIINNPKIASTTPFTNAGTICSFPDALVDNPNFAGLNVNEVDSAFKLVNPESIQIDIPTGVGFCMGINLDAWKIIDPFNEEQFGKGYGEENDWCMRALSAGYRNLMIPNLFVYHKHGGSFPSEEKQRLMKENWDKLVNLHPSYPGLVQNFISIDPPKPLRKFASTILMSVTSLEKPILIIDHQVGGGANAYREQMVQRRLDSGQAVFILTFDLNWQAARLQILYKEYKEVFRIQDVKDILLLGDYVHLSEIFYNNLVSYRDALQMVELIPRLKQVFKAKLTVFTHDHYALCPSYTLLDYKNGFCDLPPVEICKICLPRNAHRIPLDDTHATDIVKWRESWSNMLSEADQIICFSESSRRLLQKVYNLNDQKISVQPHRFISPFTRKPLVDFNAPLCIGVIGIINYQKGSQMVLDVARILAVKMPEYRIVVVGRLEISHKLPNLMETGPYDRSELPDLIEKHRINMCFFSSIIPETFSYVTSELIDLQMPVCAFNIGAPAERIGQYKFGHLISSIDSNIATKEILEFHDQLRKN